MIDKIYEWVKDLSFYLVLVTALLQMLPDSDYRKYIRFFTGLVLIALLLTPVLKTLHAGDLKTEILQDADWQEFQDKLQKTETKVRKQMTETADAVENGKAQDEQKKIEVKEKFSLKMLKELLWKGEKLKKDQLLILFLTGVLLLVITLPAGKEKENRKKPEKKF